MGMIRIHVENYNRTAYKTIYLNPSDIRSLEDYSGCLSKTKTFVRTLSGHPYGYYAKETKEELITLINAL